MRWWKFAAIAALAAALGAVGCGSSASSTVTITISPTTASVITNRTQQFSGSVTGNSNTAINWSVTCATNVAANTCGSIDATGLYTAPATIPTTPSTTTGGTPTIAPTVTITGTAQADTSKTATATLTIVTGISITLSQNTATVGTGEHFLFTATVNNPGCNLTSDPTCENVTWSLSTTLTGIGTIGATTGVYTAPTAVPSPSTVIITATSVADTSVTATATVTVETATAPTISSVSPNQTALGGLFQDVYITGTNFISTNNVFVNGSQLASTFVTTVSGTLIRARIPDFVLAAPPPSGVLQIGVSQQTGAIQTCTADPSLCQLTVMAVRPGVVGPSPDSIPQGGSGSGVVSFDVHGGFFGTGSNPATPAVTATYNGQLRGVQVDASQTINSTRNLQVAIGGGANSSDLAVPGLYPVAIKNNVDPTKFAVTNLAVQPTYTTPSATRIAVGSIAGSSMPSDVAVNPATGMAVVANQGSNDVSLIDLTANPPALITNLCTAAVGAATSGCAPSGPTGVAVDYVRNIALVVNSTAKTIAVVDLQQKAVSYVFPVLQDTPNAVGINPVTGRGLVAMQQKNYGVLLDVTTNPPSYVGIVSINTGTNTRVAVEPHLNWAMATPGTLGSLGIVDLNQQSNNVITAISRTTNVVTVTVANTSSAPPLSVQLGDAVQIQNIQFPVCPGATQNSCPPNSPPGSVDLAVAALAAGFDGFYEVTSLGPGQNQFSYTQTAATLTDVATQSSPQSTDPAANSTVDYSQPVATVGTSITTQGITINPETQQAALFDPSTGGSVSIFSLLDQSITPLSLTSNNAPDVGTIAGAFNPLTNTVVAVNFFANTLSVIDPTGTGRRLNDNNLYTTLAGPIAVAIDPGTNQAVIANQKDNSVSVLNMGVIQPFSITETSPKTFVTTSTLGSGPNPPPLNPLTVIGKGLTCTNGSTTQTVRLDGSPLVTNCAGNGDRELTAIVPSGMLTSARRYALDVADTSGRVTNAEALTVEQSIDVTAACPQSQLPLPSGVAIDPNQNIAAVTLFNCSSVALIDMTTGEGVTQQVGPNPIGVAMLPRYNVAVVANNGGAGTASVVPYANSVILPQTITTGTGAIGAAADEATGEVAITNSVANTVSVINVNGGGSHSISTGQRPIAAGFNYTNHEVAVANSSSNTIGVSDGGAASQTQSFNVTAPTSVIYDPVTTDCGSNTSTGSTTNTVGCFLAVSSTGNTVYIIDPIANIQNGFRVGINPTAIAYNYFTSTLVSTNTASHTITVADLLGQKIRAVLTYPPSPAANSDLALSLAAAGSLQYAVAIHPFTNVAVIADTANGRVLFVPLPR